MAGKKDFGGESLAMIHFSSMYGDIREWWKDHQLEVWLALILAAVCAVLIELGKGTWVGPESYKIYLVGNLDNSQIKATYKPFQDAADKNKLQIGGVPIEVRTENDHGSPTTAAEIARRIRGLADTLLVIGSVRSQETKATIPVYMSAVPRIPVITTTESEDDLLSSCPECDNDFTPLLQLSPTNKVQAASALRYALEKGRTRFLIVSEENTDNPDYGTNLVKDFRDAIKSESYKKIQLVGQVKLGEPPSLESLKRFKPDCVFYAGEPGPAHSLMDAISEYAVHAPITVILSDSSVTPELVNDSINNFKSVVYTYASDALFYRRSVSVFGQDAFAIVSQIIGDSELYQPSTSEKFRRVAGMRRVTDARTDIIRVMERNALKNHTYMGESGEQYQFASYQRQGGIFHVWEVEGGSVVDIDGWHRPAQ